MNPLRLGAKMYADTMEKTGEYMEKMAVLPDRMQTMQDVEVGATPHETVRPHPDYDLLHYAPDTKVEEDTPLLLVYSLINKSYIMDLQEDRSIVEDLVDEGHDVYMIDWNDPGNAGASLTLDDYVNRYIDDCVDTVRDRADTDTVNMLGYCMGGSLTGMYAAMEPDKLNTLAMMAAVTAADGCAGEMEEWLDKYDLDPEQITDTYGNAPAEMFTYGFAMREPVDNFVTNYVGVWDNIEDEEFVEFWSRMEQWKNDGVDVAGPAYAQFVKDVYQDDKFTDGAMQLNGKPVDLDAVDMPVLQIVGEHDDLVPPASSTAFNDAVASTDTDVITAPTGHIGLAVSSTAHRELWPQVSDWFKEHS